MAEVPDRVNETSGAPQDRITWLDKRRSDEFLSTLKEECEKAGYVTDEASPIKEGRFAIGYTELTVPPTSIKIADDRGVQTVEGMRSSSAALIKTGRGEIRIDIELKFPNKETIDNEFRHILAQFKTTPFMHITNDLISDSVQKKIVEGLQSVKEDELKEKLEAVNNQLESIYRKFNSYHDKTESGTTGYGRAGAALDSIKKLIDNEFDSSTEALSAQELLDQAAGDLYALGSSHRGVEGSTPADLSIKAEVANEVGTLQTLLAERRGLESALKDLELTRSSSVSYPTVPVAAHKMSIQQDRGDDGSPLPETLKVNMSFFYFNHSPSSGMFAYKKWNGAPTVDPREGAYYRKYVGNRFIRDEAFRGLASEDTEIGSDVPLGKFKEEHTDILGFRFPTSIEKSIPIVADIDRYMLPYRTMKADKNLQFFPEKWKVPIKESKTGASVNIYEDLVFNEDPSLIIEGVAISFENKLATQPLEGALHPTYQYMGGSSGKVSVVLTAVGKGNTTKERKSSHDQILRKLEYMKIESEKAALTGPRMRANHRTFISNLYTHLAGIQSVQLHNMNIVAPPPGRAGGPYQTTISLDFVEYKVSQEQRESLVMPSDISKAELRLAINHIVPYYFKNAGLGTTIITEKTANDGSAVNNDNKFLTQLGNKLIGAAPGKLYAATSNNTFLNKVGNKILGSKAATLESINPAGGVLSENLMANALVNYLEVDNPEITTLKYRVINKEISSSYLESLGSSVAMLYFKVLALGEGGLSPNSPYSMNDLLNDITRIPIPNTDDTVNIDYGSFIDDIITDYGMPDRLAGLILGELDVNENNPTVISQGLAPEKPVNFKIARSIKWRQGFLNLSKFMAESNIEYLEKLQALESYNRDKSTYPDLNLPRYGSIYSPLRRALYRSIGTNDIDSLYDNPSNDYILDLLKVFFPTYEDLGKVYYGTKSEIARSWEHFADPDFYYHRERLLPILKRTGHALKKERISALPDVGYEHSIKGPHSDKDISPYEFITPYGDFGPPDYMRKKEDRSVLSMVNGMLRDKVLPREVPSKEVSGSALQNLNTAYRSSSNQLFDYVPVTPEARKHHIPFVDGGKSYANALAQRIGEEQKDNRFRMSQCFPTYQVYFLEEDNESWGLMDDVVSYMCVNEIRLSRHHIRPDTATISLTNLSGNLDEGLAGALKRRKYRYKDDPKTWYAFAAKWALADQALPDQAVDLINDVLSTDNTRSRWNENRQEYLSFALSKAFNPRDESTAPEEEITGEEEIMDHFFLGVGTQIAIKMGYSSDPDDLELVFTGQISEINRGPVIEIVAQDYSTELTTPINAEVYQEKWYLPLFNKAGATPPTVIDEVLNHSGFKGEHFGTFDYASLMSSLRDDRFGGFGYRDALYNADYSSGKRLAADWSDFNPFSSGGGGGSLRGSLNLFEYVDTLAARKRGRRLENVFFPLGSYLYNYMNRDAWGIAGSSGLEVLNELSLHHPGWVAAVRPYDLNGATLFFGKPGHYYFYTALKKSDEIEWSKRRRSNVPTYHLPPPIDELLNMFRGSAEYESYKQPPSPTEPDIDTYPYEADLSRELAAIEDLLGEIGIKALGDHVIGERLTKLDSESEFRVKRGELLKFRLILEMLAEWIAEQSEANRILWENRYGLSPGGYESYKQQLLTIIGEGDISREHQYIISNIVEDSSIGRWWFIEFPKTGEVQLASSYVIQESLDISPYEFFNPYGDFGPPPQYDVVKLDSLLEEVPNSSSNINLFTQAEQGRRWLYEVSGQLTLRYSSNDNSLRIMKQQIFELEDDTGYFSRDKFLGVIPKPGHALFSTNLKEEQHSESSEGGYFTYKQIKDLADTCLDEETQKVWKRFLYYFHRWLMNEADTASLMDHVFPASRNLDAYKFSPRAKPFRRYHSANSNWNIIYDRIYVTGENSHNAVKLWYAESVDWDTQRVNVPGKHYEAIRATNTSYAPFTLPYHKELPLPLWRVKEVTSYNANSMREAELAGYGHLANTIGEMYQGEIVLRGNAEIQPYDVVYLNDYYKDLVGPLEVKEVVHHLTKNEGFFSVVYPKAMVLPNTTSDHVHCHEQGYINFLKGLAGYVAPFAAGAVAPGLIVASTLGGIGNILLELPSRLLESKTCTGLVGNLRGRGVIGARVHPVDIIPLSVGGIPLLPHYFNIAPGQYMTRGEYRWQNVKDNIGVISNIVKNLKNGVPV